MSNDEKRCPYCGAKFDVGDGAHDVPLDKEAMLRFKYPDADDVMIDIMLGRGLKPLEQVERKENEPGIYRSK